MTLYEYIKNALLILILLQLGPILIASIFKQYRSYLEPHTKVGLLKITGVLNDSTYYTKQLHKFFRESDIKAILIKMNCRGSTSGTGYAIFNEIRTLKKKHPKPIIVLIENVCASGGYWIACAADHIISPASALIGSIGVTLPYLFQLHEFIEQYKVGYTPMKSGKYKDIGNPFVSITPDDKIMLQNVLNDEYKQFTQAVAKTRNLLLTKSNEWANGKIFTGLQAKKIGLINEVGSISNAIKVIKDKALIVGKIQWVKPSARPRGLFNFFMNSQYEEESSMVRNVLNQACIYLENRYMAVKIQ